jgi:quercetin dioxygenase-like cupin family protein
MNSEPFDLRHTLAFAHGDGTISTYPADDFWRDPQVLGGRDSALIGVFSYDEDWPQWEVHPEGDELVSFVSGEVRFYLEGIDEPLHLRAGHSVIVPKGTWHRAEVVAPGAAVHVTFGQGTRNRPR